MTTDTTPTALPPARRKRRSLLGLFLRDARVADIEDVSEHFRIIDLEGEELRDRHCEPGNKLQIGVRRIVGRAYTPLNWDSERGRTRFLTYLHGNSLGCEWARNAELGTDTTLFGPNPSLDLQSLGPKAALFGDETCFGLATVWRRVPERADVRHIFEVSDAAEAADVLDQLGVENVTLVERRADEAHLAEIERQLTTFAVAGRSLVLTGKAQSIQSIKRILRRSGTQPPRMLTKAYWAPGKKGMD